MRTVPGVGSVYTVGLHHQPFRESEIMLLAIDLDGLFRMHQERGISARMKAIDDPSLREGLLAGRDIIVSENFMHRYGAPPGSQVELQTAEGPRTFRVARAVEDYSWPAGMVVMERAVYRKLWRDDLVAYIDLRVAPGSTVDEVRSRVAEKLRGTYTAFLYSPDELRGIAAEALDQAFQLSNIQVLIAVIIGFLGILNTLLISVLRRTREIGLLRAVGATRGQIRRTVMIESFLMAAVGGAIGVLAGVAGAAFPLRLHTLQVTGYWIPLSIPWGWIAAAAGAAVAIGYLASLLPARRAARLNVLEAIAYE
jgi:putative ABC transport system permease protein